MAITLYGTTELIAVQQAMPSLPDGFWRDKFTQSVNFDGEDIMFERLDVDDRRLAPFVAPNVQGRVMRGQGFSARSLRPAYVKPKHVVDPSKTIKRRFGEALLGSLSPAARADAAIADNMRLEREMIERRWDWMGARAMIDGQVVIVGDDYPSVTVSFNRDASLNVTLSGTARWDQTGTADPLTDLGTMSDAAFAAGNAPITDIVFGTLAWKNFLKNAAVLDLLNTQKRGSSSDFQRTTLVPQGNFQRMGFIGGPTGSFDLWRYSNWYSDVDSVGRKTRKEFLDPKEVVGYGNSMNGIVAFGAIMDMASLAAVDMFPKMWMSDDPSAVYTMTQSAPLLVPTNPNNTFRLRVIT